MSASEIGKPGFRYRTDFERPAPELIESYRDLMNKTGCLTGNVGDCTPMPCQASCPAVGSAINASFKHHGSRLVLCSPW